MDYKEVLVEGGKKRIEKLYYNFTADNVQLKIM